MTLHPHVARKGFAFALAAIALFALPASVAEIVLTNDRGETIRLPHPAKRIVSLAPGLTEMLYAAGERLVGTVEFGDYPAGHATTGKNWCACAPTTRMRLPCGCPLRSGPAR